MASIGRWRAGARRERNESRRGREGLERGMRCIGGRVCRRTVCCVCTCCGASIYTLKGQYLGKRKNQEKEIKREPHRKSSKPFEIACRDRAAQRGATGACATSSRARRESRHRRQRGRRASVVAAQDVRARLARREAHHRRSSWLNSLCTVFSSSQHNIKF